MNFKSKSDKTNVSVYDAVQDLTSRKRVTRTIVFEGPSIWVEDTLKRSWVSPGRPVNLPIMASVTELDRVEEAI